MTIRTDTASPPPPRFHYDVVQRGLHWLMALIIVSAIALGVYAALQIPGTSPRREVLEIHKSLGMSALVLVAIRILYRVWKGEPSYRRPLARLVEAGAKAGHLALYMLMVFMPLSGYLFSAAGGYSLPWFGLLSWPRLLRVDKSWALAGQSLHHWGAWLLGGVLLVHLLAVVWHAVVRHDEVLSRMLPSTTSRGRGRAE